MEDGSTHWVRLMSNDELPDGDFIRGFRAEGRKLCVLRHLGELHVVQATCPHAGGMFAGGWCKDGMLVCPIHRYQYDLQTGRGAPGQGDYIEKYPIRIEDDGIYAGLPRSWWRRLFG